MSHQPILFADAPARVRPVAARPRDVESAAALPATVRFGTSSWFFEGWSGLVYQGRHDSKVLSRFGLGAYAAHPLLSTVCVDRTLYGPLTAPQWEELAEQVPDSFRFVSKAHEDCVTVQFGDIARHGLRRGAVNDWFLDPAYATDTVVGPWLEGTKDKAGFLLFQFPPQDVRPIGGPDAFGHRLGEFLARLPKEGRYAVELRNAELCTEAYRAAMQATGAVHCPSGRSGMPAIPAQCRAGGVADSDTVMIRWNLHPGRTYGQAEREFRPFDRLRDPDLATRRDIARIVAWAVRTAREAWIIVTNKAEGCAPLSIGELASEIVAEGGGP